MRTSAFGDESLGDESLGQRPVPGGSGWLVHVRPSLPTDGPRIRRPGPDDADFWVQTYLDAMAATYSTLLPPEFLDQQRARASELVERYRSVFTAERADPHCSHQAWYAEDAIGPVGIAEVRTGPSKWELDRGFPPPGPPRQLVKLYVLPRAHGTGLGQALLDTAIQADSAYLWIMAGNPRAEAFYRRNRFVPDGLAAEAGATWFHRAMFRMHRTPPPVRATATAPVRSDRGRPHGARPSGSHGATT
jgi:GNAT superfamily N-acetyltransferase